MSAHTLLTVLTSAIVSAIISILTVYISHILSRKRSEIQDFNRAAENFRLAFWDEIRLLDRKYLTDRASFLKNRRVCDILFEACEKHQSAVFLFAPYIKKEKRCCFYKRWNQYCKEGANLQFFAEEYPPDEIHRDKQYSQKALRRIYRILKFADPK